MSPRIVLVRKKQNWRHLQVPRGSNILSGDALRSATTVASDGAWEQRGKTSRRPSSVEHSNNFCSHTFSAHSFGNQTLRILFEVTRARMYSLPFKIIIIIIYMFFSACNSCSVLPGNGSRGIGSLQNGLTASCQPPCGCCELL